MSYIEPATVIEFTEPVSSTTVLCLHDISLASLRCGLAINIGLNACLGEIHSSSRQTFEPCPFISAQMHQLEGNQTEFQPLVPGFPAAFVDTHTLAEEGQNTTLSVAVLNTPLPEHHAFEIIVGVLKALRKAGAKSIVIPVAGKLKGISPKHDELVNNPVLTVDSTGVHSEAVIAGDVNFSTGDPTVNSVVASLANMTSRDCDAVGLVCEGCKQTSRFDAGEGFEQTAESLLSSLLSILHSRFHALPSQIVNGLRSSSHTQDAFKIVRRIPHWPCEGMLICDAPHAGDTIYQ